MKTDNSKRLERKWEIVLLNFNAAGIDCVHALKSTNMSL